MCMSWSARTSHPLSRSFSPATPPSRRPAPSCPPQVRDELTLRQSLDKLQTHGVRCRAFLEPDLGNELTALATEPVFDGTRRLFRRFPLLRPRWDVVVVRDSDFTHP